MIRLLALCGAVLFALPAQAAAEWHFVPMTGITFGGRTTLLDPQQGVEKKHVQIGGAAALVGDGFFGVEAIAVFTPSLFLGKGSFSEISSPSIAEIELSHGRSFAVMGNVVLTTPKKLTEYSLRPFVSGGFGVMSSSVEDPNGVISVKSDLAGFNIGVGAVGFLSERVGVRFDLRTYRTFHRPFEGRPISFGPPGLTYYTASVGIVFRR